MIRSFVEACSRRGPPLSALVSVSYYILGFVEALLEGSLQALCLQMRLLRTNRAMPVLCGQRIGGQLGCILPGSQRANTTSVLS